MVTVRPPSCILEQILRILQKVPSLSINGDNDFARLFTEGKILKKADSKNNGAEKEERKESAVDPAYSFLSG